MALALNLRFDLARLSDAALAERCDAIWTELDQLETDQGPIRTAKRWRGPVRHPRAYVFWAMFGTRGGGEMDVLVSAFAAGTALADVVAHAPGVRLHLALCEMQDILDEMKSRSAAKRRG